MIYLQKSWKQKWVFHQIFPSWKMISGWPKMRGAGNPLENPSANQHSSFSHHPLILWLLTRNFISLWESVRDTEMACSAASTTAALISSNPRARAFSPKSKPSSQSLPLPNSFTGLRAPLLSRVARSVSLSRASLSRKPFVVKASVYLLKRSSSFESFPLLFLFNHFFFLFFSFFLFLYYGIYLFGSILSGVDLIALCFFHLF